MSQTVYRLTDELQDLLSCYPQLTSEPYWLGYTSYHGADHAEEEEGVSEDLRQVVVDGVLPAVPRILTLPLLTVPISVEENIIQIHV